MSRWRRPESESGAGSGRMRRNLPVGRLAAVACLVGAGWIAAAGPAVAAAEPPLARGSARIDARSYDGLYDLQALWGEACAAGWQAEDAVILLDRRQLRLEGGRWTEFRHRVVRIASEFVLEGYADLRVAYDTTRGDLTVQSLRTLRDGQWIESGPTARVETTPYALEHAPACWGWRERMLLHDGVEVPCVVETAWTITRGASPFDDGPAGVHLFAQPDPVVRSELVVLFSDGSGGRLEVRPRGGAPEPVRGDLATLRRSGAALAPVVPAEGTVPAGADGLAVVVSRLAAVGEPGPDPVAAGLPAMAWSTLTWNELGRALHAEFTQAARLDTVAEAALFDTVRARVSGATVASEIARRIATLVGERTRLVDYPPPAHREPRGAADTYASGHALVWERAALGSALLRAAGLEPRLVLAARAWAPFSGDDPPSLARFGDPLVSVYTPAGGNHDPAIRVGLFDPREAAFFAGDGRVAGRFSWEPGFDDRPAGTPSTPERPRGALSLLLDLQRDSATGAWTGQGVLAMHGVLSAFEEMEGLGGQTQAWLEGAVGEILSGAEVAGYNLSRFEPGDVVCGLTVKLAPPEADEAGRQRLELGAPAGGVESLLPADLHRHAGTRETPVILPAPVSQSITLRLRLSADEIVRLPDETVLQNQAGRFVSRVTREGPAVRIERMLELDAPRVEPAAWPDLRALLLAESHPRHRVLLCRASAEAAGPGGKP